MKPTITAFEDSPDEGQGLARDMRVRWALEEVGQPSDVRLASMKELKEPEHRARNPFGRIPSYEEGDLTPSSRPLSYFTSPRTMQDFYPRVPVAVRAQ